MTEMPTDADPVRLVRGDCLDVLKALPAGCVDAVITDPPFGTDVPADGYGRRSLGGPQKRIAGDADLESMSLGLRECFRLLSPDSWCACFVSPKRHAESVRVAETAGFQVVGEVVWDKAMPGLGGGIRYQHELILLLARGKPIGLAPLFSVLRHPRPSQPQHPHEKPTRLLRKLVAYTSKPGDVVLDPFAGSGATLQAALMEGRRAFGIELDPAYCDIIRKRLAHASGTAPGSLFAGATA